MKRIAIALGTLVFTSLACFTQPFDAEYVNPQFILNESLPQGLFFPYCSLSELQTLDYEHAIYYMQRSWQFAIKDHPNSIGFPLSNHLSDDYAPNPPSSSFPPCSVDCCCDLPRCCPFLILRHIEPGGIGYCEGYSTVDAWVPFCSRGNKLNFIDLRAHYFNDHEWAGNIGIGTRRINPCINSAYGLNIFFDLRTSCRHKHFFPQFGIGFEYLSCCFDLRLNGYFPFYTKKTIKHCHFTYPGGFFIDRDKKQVSLYGGDLEIGKCLFQEKCIQLYGAIGPYVYGKNSCVKSFVGGRARAVLSLSRYFSLEGIASYDRRYKAKYQGSVAINIPLGCCSDDNCFPCEPVVRNEILILDTYCRWKTNF